MNRKGQQQGLSSLLQFPEPRSHSPVTTQPSPSSRESASFPSSLEYRWQSLFVLLFVATLVAFFHDSSGNFVLGGHGQNYATPKALWDHNVYIPASTSSSVKEKAAYLVAQLDGPLPKLKELTDIASRPNRAYCRQHGADYVRYSRGEKSSHARKSCFDKTILLNTILDHQFRDSDSALPSPFSLRPRVEYDAVALLPPDSIIINLDTNMFKVALPNDKLVAIAGWNHHYAKSFEHGSGQFDSKTGIVFFNLRHRHSNAVAKLWWDEVQSPSVDCGAGNDLTLLVDAIASVLEHNEDLNLLIAPLVESDDGVVSAPVQSDYVDTAQKNDILKGIPPSTPASRTEMLLSDLPSATMSLTSTADSVCYRCYPRCEVF